MSRRNDRNPSPVREHHADDAERATPPRPSRVGGEVVPPGAPRVQRQHARIMRHSLRGATAHGTGDTGPSVRLRLRFQDKLLDKAPGVAALLTVASVQQDGVAAVA